MTNFTTKCMLAVAACTIAAGSAAAQTYKAQIPFTFQAAGKVMAPGAYEVRAMNRFIELRNMETFASIRLLPAAQTGERKKEGAPVKVTFACAGTRCALDSMWVGGAVGAYRFHRPKDEDTRLAAIEMTRVKAD
jgi:hypothetical protein